MEDNHELSFFLRGLADSIESKDVAPGQLARISEFFVSYQFHDQIAAAVAGGSGDFDRGDLIKFLSLGWYVYHVLLKDASHEHDDLD